MAVAGENQIRIFNLSTWKEIKNEKIDLPPGVGRVNKLLLFIYLFIYLFYRSWSSSGDVLIVSTISGFLIGFLTSVPTLTAVCGSLLAM